MADDFMSGYVKYALCPKAYIRTDILYNGDYCLWEQTVSSCNTPPCPPLDPPWGSPASIMGTWVFSHTLQYGQVGPQVYLNDSRFSSGYYEYQDNSSPTYPQAVKKMSINRRPNCTIVYRGKLDWEEAMDDLRTDYPWADGWRIVSVYRKGAGSGNDSNFMLDGTKVVSDTDSYAASQNQDAGTGSGGQDGGYSGVRETRSSTTKVKQSLEGMHRDDTISTEMEYTLEDGMISQNEGSIDDAHPDGTYTINTPEGVADGEDGWIIGTSAGGGGNICTGISGYPGAPYCFRSIASNTFCVYVYLTQVVGTSAAGDGSTFVDGSEFGKSGDGQYWGGSGSRASGSASPSNSSRLYDDGSYSNRIDGGIDDRSNGERFIGVSYESINGFDYDTEVTHDSLYIPTTTRWGETLDLTDPDTTYHGRTIGYGIVAGRGDFMDYDITINMIENRMSEADRMEFTENCKYDDVGANCVHLGTPYCSTEEVGHEAEYAFDQIDNTYFEGDNPAADIRWDFCERVIQNSTVVGAVSIGDTSITVADATYWPTSGTLFLGATGQDMVAFTARTGNVLSGIPTDGDFAVTEDHISGTAATRSLRFSGKTIRKYSIKGMGTGSTGKNPKTWTFDGGYNPEDNPTSITWDNLDTQADITDWEVDEEKLFECLDNSTRYRYYRLSISDTVDGVNNVAIVDISMYEADTWTVGDWVYGVVVASTGPETKFAGTIVNKRREITEKGQVVRYEASGMIQRLDDLGFAFDVVFSNKTVQEMATLITDNIPNQVVVDVEGIDRLPTTVIPDINWHCLSFKRALDMLMDISGYFGYYITPQKVLKFVNLRYDNSTTTTIARDDARKQSYAVPVEGTALSSGNYYIMEQLLSIDVAATRTRCQIMGDFPQYEITESIPLVTSDTNQDGSYIDPPYCMKIDRDSALSGTTALEQVYLVVLSHNKIQTQLLSDEDKAIIVEVKYSGKSYGGVQVSAGWFEPRTNPYNFITRNVYSAFYINAYDSLTEMKVTYSYKDTTPLLADTGWVGTAYTDFKVQNALLLQDPQFKKQIVEGTVIRDDSTDLAAYALQSIAPYKDWYIGGSVTLDGLRVETGLDNFFNFSGTTQDWTAINAYPKGITYDLQELTTKLELTNSYFLGSVLDPEVLEQLKIIKDSEEVQRIINRLSILESGTSQF